MKLTESAIKRLIKEEIQDLLENPQYENDMQAVLGYVRKINELVDKFNRVVTNLEIGKVRTPGFENIPREFSLKVQNVNTRYLKELKYEIDLLKREINK